MKSCRSAILLFLMLVFTTNIRAQDTARLTAYKAMMAETEMKQKRVLGEAFLEKYPQSKANMHFDEVNKISYAAVYQITIVLNVLEGSYAAIAKYVNELPYATLPVIYYKTIQIQHDRKDEKDEFLYPYAAMLVKRIAYFRINKPESYSQLTQKEWEEQVDLLLANRIMPTHVSLLYNTGHKKEALVYARQAEKYLKYKNAGLNSYYAILLHENKQTDELKMLLETSVHVNQSTPEMLDLLMQDYKRRTQDTAGFSDYMASLKNHTILKEIEAEVAKNVRNEVMPAFKMYDEKWKLVGSKDLLGKIVVLDFWATWCVPCKASFPGMKLLVDNYKKDSNVVFYFVVTEEREKNYRKEVLDYLSKNNFNFPVLFDNKKEGEQATGEVFHRICDAFKISGIPQKLVIDPQGKLRFISVGYKGSPTGLLDELSAMINYIKENG